MTEIILSCEGASARATVQGAITAGMAGTPVHIRCSGDWDGLIKSMVAMTAAGRKVMANVAEETTLPWEILKEGMRLFIGLEGRDAAGTVIIPTHWADCGRIRPSAQGGHTGTPTPGEMEQLLLTAGEATARSKKAQETADAALDISGTALEMARTAEEQVEHVAALSEKTEKNAQLARDAVGKMQYVSMEIGADGCLLLRHPEQLGGTSFRLNYGSGDLEVRL